MALPERVESDPFAEDSPFVDRPGAPAVSETQRYRLELLAIANDEALRYAKSARLTFEWCRPIVQGANSAALAVAALERLHEEIQSVQEAYGLNLTDRRAPGA